MVGLQRDVDENRAAVTWCPRARRSSRRRALKGDGTVSSASPNTDAEASPTGLAALVAAVAASQVGHPAESANPPADSEAEDNAPAPESGTIDWDAELSKLLDEEQGDGGEREEQQ